MKKQHNGAVEIKITKQLLQRTDNCTLASGIAGLLVMQAHFHSQHPTAERRARIGASIGLLVEAVRVQELPISLWEGLVGILYALEFTRGIDESLLPQNVIEFIDSMDDQLVDYIAQGASHIHFDLISGLVGIGCYALMRTDEEAAGRLYRAVESALERSSEERPDDGTRIWKTRPEHVGPHRSAFVRQTGYIDLGLAHGNPGVILCLAGGIRYGFATDLSQLMLVEALKGIVSFASPHFLNAQFNYFSPQEHTAESRLAWCYGDLSVAFAIIAAGQTINNMNAMADGISIVSHRLRKPETSFGIVDHGLCHGSVGIVHMLKKISATTGNEIVRVFVQARQRLVATAMRNEENEHARPDFLDGALGILVALNDVPHRGRHHWDVAMCMGF